MARAVLDKNQKGQNGDPVWVKPSKSAGSSGFRAESQTYLWGGYRLEAVGQITREKSVI
jgi:hypothetical protein